VPGPACLRTLIAIPADILARLAGLFFAARAPRRARQKVSLPIAAPRRYRRAQLHVAAFVAHPAARAVRDQRPLAIAAFDEPSEIQLDPAPTPGAIGGQPVTAGVQGRERVEGDRLVLAGFGAVCGHDATVARLACADPVRNSSSIVR
jgi:hypothetical protein